MEDITRYLEQITNNNFDAAKETLEAIIKNRVSSRFKLAKSQLGEAFETITRPNPQQRGYKVIRDTTGKFPVGTRFGVDLPEKAKKQGWIPFQHEGGSLVLHKVEIDQANQRKEHQLELQLF